MHTPLQQSQQQRTRTSLWASRRLPWSIALQRASRSASSTYSSISETQRDAAIRPMSHSTSGEIRIISLRTQVLTSRGAPVNPGFWSIDRRDLKLPTKIISAIPLFSPYSSALVRRAGTSRPDLACEENQRRADQASTTQNPEAVEKPEECCLLLNDPRQLRLGVQGGIWSCEAVRRKIPSHTGKGFLISLLEWRSVRHQNRLVILRPARQKSSHNSDADASSLVAEQVGNTRSLVVLVFRQEGICELANRHKEGSNAKPLERSEESDVFVVCAQVNAGVFPHSYGEDHIPDEDERLDANLWQDSYNDRGKSDDHERARPENESGIRSRVAVQALQHLRNQDCRPKQPESEEEVVSICDGEVPIREQTNFHHRIRMTPLPDSRSNQRRHGNREENDNESAL